jgi:hypothetical protein
MLAIIFGILSLQLPFFATFMLYLIHKGKLKKAQREQFEALTENLLRKRLSSLFYTVFQIVKRLLFSLLLVCITDN